MSVARRNLNGGGPHGKAAMTTTRKKPRKRAKPVRLRLVPDGNGNWWTMIDSCQQWLSEQDAQWLFGVTGRRAVTIEVRRVKGRR